MAGSSLLVVGQWAAVFCVPSKYTTSRCYSCPATGCGYCLKSRHSTESDKFHSQLSWRFCVCVCVCACVWPSPWAQPTSTPRNQQDQTGQSQSCRCPIIIITKEGGRRTERHIPPDERRAVQRQTRRFMLQDQPPPSFPVMFPTRTFTTTDTSLWNCLSFLSFFLSFFFFFFYIPCQHELSALDPVFYKQQSMFDTGMFFLCGCFFCFVLFFLLLGCFSNSILTSCSLTWFITYNPTNQHSGYIWSHLVNSFIIAGFGFVITHHGVHLTKMRHVMLLKTKSLFTCLVSPQCWGTFDSMHEPSRSLQWDF